jgi:hypothetical protein
MIKLLFFRKHRELIKAGGLKLRLFPLRLELTYDRSNFNLAKGIGQKLFHELRNKRTGIYRLIDMDFLCVDFENGSSVLIIT